MCLKSKGCMECTVSWDSIAPPNSHMNDLVEADGRTDTTHCQGAQQQQHTVQNWTIWNDVMWSC